MNRKRKPLAQKEAMPLEEEADYCLICLSVWSENNRGEK